MYLNIVFLHKDGHYITLQRYRPNHKRPSRAMRYSLIGGVRDITQQDWTKKKSINTTNTSKNSSQKRTKQLLDYERFAAMGQVAGMVGHDIRNPCKR